MGSSVTAVLEGGLGNQMFQYAAGRALGERLRVGLSLDLRRLKESTAREYSLEAFNLKPDVRLLTDGEAPRPPRRRYGLLRAMMGIRDYHKEAGFAYDPAVSRLRAPVILDGYFQSERYFADIAATIRKEFTPRADLRRQIDTLAAELIPDGPSASLHVRRGDYVGPSAMAVHGLLGPDFYERALKLLAQKSGRMPVMCVFSDDPAWVRTHLQLPPGTRYVSEHTRTPLQDLILMSRCSHHITANSSFSWWGAWLNPNPDKIVVTPARWFQPAAGLDTRDLRPDGWLQA